VHGWVLRTDLNYSEIRYKKLYFLVMHYGGGGNNWDKIGEGVIGFYPKQT